MGFRYMRIFYSYIYQNESAVTLRKPLVIFLFLLLPLAALKAQPGDSLIIHFKNGGTGLVDLRSISTIQAKSEGFIC
jgi:hypothetical protein